MSGHIKERLCVLECLRIFLVELSLTYMVKGWRAVKWIYNCGYFDKRTEILKHCRRDCFVLVGHLFNVALSLLIPLSVLFPMLVCLPRREKSKYRMIPCMWISRAGKDNLYWESLQQGLSLSVHYMKITRKRGWCGYPISCFNWWLQGYIHLSKHIKQKT